MMNYRALTSELAEAEARVNALKAALAAVSVAHEDIKPGRVFRCYARDGVFKTVIEDDSDTFSLLGVDCNPFRTFGQSGQDTIPYQVTAEEAAAWLAREGYTKAGQMVFVPA